MYPSTKRDSPLNHPNDEKLSLKNCTFFGMSSKKNSSTYLAELIGALKDSGFKLGIGHIVMDSIADAEQLVRVEDDKFGVGYEHFGRLVVLDGQDERVNGVGQVHHVRLSLSTIELHHVAVIVADLQSNHRDGLGLLCSSCLILPDNLIYAFSRTYSNLNGQQKSTKKFIQVWYHLLVERLKSFLVLEMCPEFH